ncbi:hypothetical protein GCM10010112_20310 [Actinoplanes lobatus]|nr:hypothetical protein GCM10010112_20310 [Actinoplanes lobatus]
MAAVVVAHAATCVCGRRTGGTADDDCRDWRNGRERQPGCLAGKTGTARRASPGRRPGAGAPAVTGGNRGGQDGLPGHRSTPGGRGKGGSGQRASADRTGRGG